MPCAEKKTMHPTLPPSSAISAIRPKRAFGLLGLLVAVPLSLACGTSLGEPPRGSKPPKGAGVPPVPSATDTPGPGAEEPGQGVLPGGTGPTALRRLTNTEYRNSVAKLLALAAPPADTLEADTLLNGFDNFSSALIVNGALAFQYQQVSRQHTRNLQVPECAAAEDVCARAFIETFGRQAFRRPLTPAEVDDYIALYAAEKARSSHAGGLSFVAETMLQSPFFLYRSELGDAAQGATRKLTSHEVATLLAYMFTSSPPDAELSQAADADTLATPTVLEQQVRRLMQLPQARNALRQFVRVFSGTTRFLELRKDADTFPEFSFELKQAMEDETNAFIDAVLFEGDGSLNTLYTAPYSFINDTLAQAYGLPSPGAAGTLVKTTLPASERAGLLTQASLLATHAKAYDSFPIARGKLVRVGLLCQSLPPMPPNIVVSPPPQDPNLTTRERFAQHSADPGCSGCHALLDPLGFGLENYDGIGRYRTHENGKPIDAQGLITGSRDVDGPYQGGPELATKLGQSLEAKECLALKALKWSLGREDVSGERELVNTIAASLAPGGLDLREVLVSLTKTPQFVTRSFR
jgi:hypothetical protein